METRPDAPARDLGIVTRAAASIEVSEYALFQLAYQWWYGRPAPPDLLDRAFAAYMREATAAPWARHYGRELLSGDLGDAGHRRRLGLDRLPPAPAPPAHGWLAVLATLAGAALALAILAAGSGEADPHAGGDSLACSPAPGLRAFDSLARAFAERPPDDCRAP